MHPGAYRGNKRQKELKRLAKQEEKRQKRLQKGDEGYVSPINEEIPLLDGPVHHFVEETPAEEGAEESSPETPGADDDPANPEPGT